MFAAKPVLAVLLAIGVGYVTYPYVTLYRLGHALHNGDATTLRTLVDWPAVRDGIKQDICDHGAANPTVTVSDGELPAFGASFVQGIATNEVDQHVTPQGLVAMTHHHSAGPATNAAAMDVNWAFFDDPTGFLVSVSEPGRPEPIKLQMTLRDGIWQVTRIWLPPDLLKAANART